MPKNIEGLTLGQFRELTKNIPDDTILVITSESDSNKALPVIMYPFETNIDNDGFFLLSQDCDESIDFES